MSNLVIQYGRKVGKTTRLVDSLIQHLFEGKKIYFPSRERVKVDLQSTQKQVMQKNCFNEQYWQNQNTVIGLDQEGHIGLVQDHLKRVFLSRLELEHGIWLKNKITSYDNLLIIQLSDFKKYGDD